MKKLILTLILLLLSSGILFAQQQEPLADKLTDMLKSDVFRVGILLQSEGYFSFEDDNFNGGRQFDIGATRLDFRGTIDNSFTYRLQLDFRRQTSVMDAQVGYLFNKNHRMVAGSFKPFLSRDLDPSPGNTDFMDRARLVGVMMNSREIGLTFLGEPGDFNYRLGIYNGTGMTRQNDNRFMYTARLGYRFDLEDDVLELGFNGALNQTQNVQVGNTGLTSEGDRTILGGFVEYTGSTLFGTFELLTTRFDASELSGNEETILGYYITLGAHISDKNELLTRWDYIEYDITNRTSTLISLGWNHQATRLISFQVNGLALLNKDMDEQFGISGGFQFQF